MFHSVCFGCLPLTDLRVFLLFSIIPSNSFYMPCKQWGRGELAHSFRALRLAMSVSSLQMIIWSLMCCPIDSSWMDVNSARESLAFHTSKAGACLCSMHVFTPIYPNPRFQNHPSRIEIPLRVFNFHNFTTPLNPLVTKIRNAMCVSVINGNYCIGWHQAHPAMGPR